jgi:hypothetical protein
VEGTVKRVIGFGTDGTASNFGVGGIRLDAILAGNGKESSRGGVGSKLVVFFLEEGHEVGVAVSFAQVGVLERLEEVGILGVVCHGLEETRQLNFNRDVDTALEVETEVQLVFFCLLVRDGALNAVMNRLVFSAVEKAAKRLFGVWFLLRRSVTEVLGKAFRFASIFRSWLRTTQVKESS